MFECNIDDRITLKMLEVSDAEAIFALVDASRAYLRQWLPWVDATQSVHDTRSFIQCTLDQHAEENGLACRITFQGHVAGVIGIDRIDWTNLLTEIGYWLRPDYQGRGIMTKSCRALVNYAFAELGLHRVEIRAAPGNVKSLAIPQRLGFTREGMLREAERLYDRFVDSVVYAMLRRDWDATLSPGTVVTRDHYPSTPRPKTDCMRVPKP